MTRAGGLHRCYERRRLQQPVGKSLSSMCCNNDEPLCLNLKKRQIFGGKQKFGVARPFGTIFKSYRYGSFRNQLICCSSWCKKKTKQKKRQSDSKYLDVGTQKGRAKKKVIISISNQKSTFLETCTRWTLPVINGIVTHNRHNPYKWPYKRVTVGISLL